MTAPDLRAQLGAFLADQEAGLVALRRDLHAHPETAWSEHRTTRKIAAQLSAAGLHPVVLPGGTGLTADITGAAGPVVALRADIDALPVSDVKDVPYRSKNDGACHACGHDVHTTALTGAALFLARAAAAGALPGTVRLIFQPAEEAAGGAVSVIDAGGLDRVEKIFALHCDPRLGAGQVGTRAGAITAACDRITVTLRGPGGHTARPHLTADLVFALAKIITEVPAALSRRVDPRAGLSLVWGRVSAGSAANAIPAGGVAEGTIRCLDAAAWRQAPALVKGLIEAVAASYGAAAEVSYRQEVPPVVNEPAATALLAAAAGRVLGEHAVTATPQSLGGEDFSWYLESVPGSMARLGTRTPGAEADFDLHQPAFDVDERAIGHGAAVLAAAALAALDAG